MQLLSNGDRILALFSDITHPSRIRILKILNNNPMNLTEISKKLDLSKPEISRHLSKLRELGLIQHEEKTNLLTDLGISILTIVSPLDVILDNYEYFTGHSLTFLPDSFIKEINSLSESDLITGAGLILKKIFEITNEMSDEMKLMTSQPSPSFPQEKKEKIKIIAPSYAKKENIDPETILNLFNNFEIRLLDEINIALVIVDEKYGMLAFPTLDGLVDANYSFFVESSDGMVFLNKLWDYYWELAKFISKSD
jgi:predicted transcriptional regulator